MILRIHNSKSAAEVVKYFTSQRAQQEASYYSRDGQEFAGYWGGKGAEMLGLKGRVTDEAFARLVDNQYPFTGHQITPRMRADRRPGFDLNFNVPKSVSLVYARTKDERIIQALRQTHLDTLLDMEAEAATRVRVNGQSDGDRKTGILVWAENIHLTARPEGGIPDPHLHSHCYVFNMTWDEAEKKWKALQMGLIHKKAAYYNKVATFRLAENLQKLGLEIVPTKDAFEIVGISRELIEKFSRRTKTIEEEAIRRGITDPVQKAKLGALTREKKGKEAQISELEPFWWGSLTSEEAHALDSAGLMLRRSLAAELSQRFAGNGAERVPGAVDVGPGKAFLGQKGWDWVRSQAGEGERMSLNKATRPFPSPKRVVKPSEHDYRAVALAIEHVFERHSVVTEDQLAEAALDTFFLGKATLMGVHQALAEAPLIRRERDGEKYVFTAEVLAEEKWLAARCIDGKGRCDALNKFWKIEDEKLNPQQRNAVLEVLHSTDRIVGIAGRAGTGKTTLLHELRRGIQSGMNNLIALAPTSEAAREVLRNEGFENAETVAKLLHSEALQREARGAVWLVDEAGLLSTREAKRLIELADKLGARLVLIGDTGQHHAVERGQAFDLLQKKGRMSVAYVTEIQRQKGAYKHFVEHILNHDMDKAFGLLDHLDAISEMTLEQRKIALAKDYIGAIERGKTALVVAPTHAECRDVTAGIREGLKERGKLKAGVEWDVLRNLSWTDALKSDCGQYEKGIIAQINGHVRGFALGEQVEVVGVRDGVVRVRCKDGMDLRIRPLPLDRPKLFSVYERDKVEICEGDLVRVTGSGYTDDDRRHQLSNGKVWRVDHITHEGKIVFENGWTVGRKFKHLDHGYALTSHAAQGKTVDWVFVAQTAQLSSCASDLRQFYVSTTRGREGVKIYTDSIELLKEQVSSVRERPMATEFVPDVPLADKLGQQDKVQPEWEPAKIGVDAVGLRQVHKAQRAAEHCAETADNTDVRELGVEAGAELQRIGRKTPEQELEQEDELEMEI